MKAHELIKKYRILNKMTQKEVAEIIGMTHSGYSKYERGERKIQLDLLGKLAPILHFSIFDVQKEFWIFEKEDLLDISSNYERIAKVIRRNKGSMTEIEKQNARQIFIEKYQEIEERKKRIMILLEPRELIEVAQSYGIGFLFEN